MLHFLYFWIFSLTLHQTKDKAMKKNPFIGKLKAEARIGSKSVFKRVSGSAVIDSDGAIVEGDVYMKSVVPFDLSPSTKVYEGILDVVHGLTSTSMIVLFYIISNVDKHGVVDLSIESLSKGTRISRRQSLYTAIKDLSSADVICKSESRSFYWVNPKYISRRNQSKVISEYE